MTAKSTGGEKGSDGERGSEEGTRGLGGEYGDWWRATDPEKASRFLHHWQEWMKDRERDGSMEVFRQSMERMLEGWWGKGGLGLGGGFREGGRGEKGGENETRHTVPSDAVMGFILSLLQRCDRLEERIRVLEEERKG